MIARLTFLLVLAVGELAHGESTHGRNVPLPVWLGKMIAEKASSQSRDVIEQGSYKSKRVFEFISGDRFDTGDEHTLFDENGKEICRFGGLAGHVSQGVCDINEIVYVSTLFGPDAR